MFTRVSAGHPRRRQSSPSFFAIVSIIVNLIVLSACWNLSKNPFHHSVVLLETENKDTSQRKQVQQEQEQQHELEDADGWKTIHVFRGKRKELQEMTEASWRRQGGGKLVQDESQWMSQVKQDRTISSLYHGKKTNGFFLDLAVNAAVHLSNTYALERKFN